MDVNSVPTGCGNVSGGSYPPSTLHQVRNGEGSLIHVRITMAAFTLLSLMNKASMKLFGKITKTIGECSRAIKEVLILKRNYKSRLFSG